MRPLGFAKDRRCADSRYRHAILKVVQQNPGLPITEVMERLGIGWGTTYHHLARLIRSGELRSQKVGRRRMLFATSSPVDTAEVTARALIRGRSARQIAGVIAARDGLSVLELCDLVEQSPRVVYYHIRRLLAAALVTSGSRTRHTDLRADERLVRVLADTAEKPGVDLPEDPRSHDFTRFLRER